jgi:DNA-binding NarL/FixJ family response regulator
VPALQIVVCDDHEEFRAGLVALLATDEGLDVVGEATDGESAVEVVTARQPDVVLMDLAMPRMNGIEATRRITRAMPHIGIVVLTMVENDDSVSAAMQAGARGYLLKSARKPDIVRAVADGEAIFGPAIAQRLMRFFAAPPTMAGRVSPRDAFPQLTDRESGILALMAEHLTQSRDRRPAWPYRKDRTQQRVSDLHKAAGRRPRARHHRGP